MGATGLSVIGKGCVAAAFVGLHSYTAELAPTMIRNAALSFGSAAARVAGMAAPYVGGPLVSIQFLFIIHLFILIQDTPQNHTRAPPEEEFFRHTLSTEVRMHEGLILSESLSSIIE